MTPAWPLAGNQNRLAELADDLKNNRLAHAYLFAGPTEVGKFSAAKYFANLLLCPDGACGACPICRQIRANVYEGLTVADELWIEDVSEDWEVISRSSNFNQLHRSKSPKARSDALGIADLTEILTRLNSTRDGRQVFLIRGVERLTPEATNAFLKTLEEPPRNTIFLLTTDNLPTLSETLVSRCRVVQFTNVAESLIVTELARRFPHIAAADRAKIATLALGKPGRAITLATDPDGLTAYAEYFRQLKNLFEKPDRGARLAFAELAAATHAETAKFLEALTYFLRSFLLTRARTPVVGSRYNATRLAGLIRATDTTRTLIAANVNSRLALENLLLSL